jgi:hypothetical protein
MKHKDGIIKVFKKLKRPLQARTIYDHIEVDLSFDSLKVVLHICEKEGILASIKYPGTPMFYCKPEWVEDGKLREDIEFNPHWHNHVKIKTDGVKDQ